MVERYHAELLPVATQLSARLVCLFTFLRSPYHLTTRQCDSYVRLMSEGLKQEENMESEGDFEKGYDSSAGDDDKTFAAMGVAKTIGTVSIFRNNLPL